MKFSFNGAGQTDISGQCTTEWKKTSIFTTLGDHSEVCQPASECTPPRANARMLCKGARLSTMSQWPVKVAGSFQNRKRHACQAQLFNSAMKMFQAL